MPTTHIVQTGILDLIAQSGLVAKLVLLVLLATSIACWTIILTKWKTLGSASKQNEKFFTLFWGGKSLDEIVSKSEELPYSPAASSFRFAVKELRRLSGNENQSSHSATAMNTNKVDNINRALIRASTKEIAALERNLGLLASTASAAPFIGLFGTVWGIMNSFQSIGATGAASLAVVAPGISEALITTATGIGAAIPAVIAYNYFIGRIKRISIDLECFCQDFMNIVQRSYLNGNKEN